MYRSFALMMLLVLANGCAGNVREEGPDPLAWREIVDLDALNSAFQSPPLDAGTDTVLAVARYGESGLRQAIHVSSLRTLPADLVDEVTLRLGAATPTEVAPTEFGRSYFFRLALDGPEVLPPPTTEQAPALANSRWMQTRLLDLLRDFPELARRGIRVNLEVNERGEVVDWMMVESSGESVADEVFMALAREAEFTPAKVGDYTVRSWVQLPISVQMRDRAFGPPETPPSP